MLKNPNNPKLNTHISRRTRNLFSVAWTIRQEKQHIACFACAHDFFDNLLRDNAVDLYNTIMIK